MTAARVHEAGRELKRSAALQGLHHRQVIAGDQVQGDAIVGVRGRRSLALDQRLALAVQEGEACVETIGVHLGHEQPVGADAKSVQLGRAGPVDLDPRRPRSSPRPGRLPPRRGSGGEWGSALLRAPRAGKCRPSADTAGPRTMGGPSEVVRGNGDATMSSRTSSRGGHFRVRGGELRINLAKLVRRTNRLQGPIGADDLHPERRALNFG